MSCIIILMISRPIAPSHSTFVRIRHVSDTRTNDIMETVFYQTIPVSILPETSSYTIITVTWQSNGDECFLFRAFIYLRIHVSCG